MERKRERLMSVPSGTRLENIDKTASVAALIIEGPNATEEYLIVEINVVDDDKNIWYCNAFSVDHGGLSVMTAHRSRNRAFKKMMEQIEDREKGVPVDNAEV